MGRRVDGGRFTNEASKTVNVLNKGDSSFGLTIPLCLGRAGADDRLNNSKAAILMNNAVARQDVLSRWVAEW